MNKFEWKELLKLLEKAINEIPPGADELFDCASNFKDWVEEEAKGR